MTDSNNIFQRDERYLVFKLSDIEKLKQKFGANSALLDGLYATCSAIDSLRRIEGRDILQCVVVEHDWPEYETVWEMIEQRVTNGH